MCRFMLLFEIELSVGDILRNKLSLNILIGRFDEL